MIKVKSVLYAILMELYALKEYYYFSKRNKRYFFTALFLYLYSLKSLKNAHYLRMGFAVLQHIDDVLDGDRIIKENPLVYVDNILTKGATLNENKKAKSIEKLTNYLLAIIRKIDVNGCKVEEHFANLVNLLKYDFYRREHALILHEAKLKEHHYNTFYNSVAITLKLSGSDKKAEDEKELITALSWCSPVRDISDDYKIGLINIPKEILASCSLNNEAIFNCSSYKLWLKNEFNIAKQAFADYDKKENKLTITKYFMIALKQFANKYQAASHNPIVK